MQKNCKICEKEFEIRSEDLVFYEQIKVPPPNYCPECRAQRRICFRNEKTLYKRKCDLCKKDAISVYPSDTIFPVYCHQCWWGDGWNPITFGVKYDNSKPFLEQYAELKNKIPRIALLVIESVNSDYTSNSGYNKNCYLIIAAENNEDCMYGRLIQNCKTSNDCNFLYESELCYECSDCIKCFKCLYSERLQDCIEVLFSFDMRNCQNCIFCTNGRSLNYCIENVQHTKEDFEKKKAEIFSSYDSIEKAKEKYKKMREKALVKYASATKCNNVTGDYMHNCHDGVNLFDVRNSKNCSYVADGEDPIDCHDVNNMYFKAERCYNIMGSLQSHNCIVSNFVMYCDETNYSDGCYNCVNCFGCVGLNKKNYHILNKEYEKEEYQKIKKEIITQLKKDGIYGDYFPPALSPFGYNETLAQDYFPLTKEEAIKKGFNWQDKTTGTYGKETIKEKEMPETIGEVSDNILQEILVCKDCKKNFRITEGELNFYKRMSLPLPHKDFECRHQERMAKRNPRKLWHRSCMCDKKTHLHNDKKCENEFETSYSPDRSEIIYCETCYQQEVY